MYQIRGGTHVLKLYINLKFWIKEEKGEEKKVWWWWLVDKSGKAKWKETDGCQTL